MYAEFPEEGDTCKAKGCGGTLQFPASKNCSCHIRPPCSACTDLLLTCDKCGWEDDSPPDRYIGIAPGLAMLEHRPRPFDNTKIDYRVQMHSNASQKCIGVYPEGATRADVQKVVDGTFGGRFESFGDNKFVFIAYTD